MRHLLPSIALGLLSVLLLGCAVRQSRLSAVSASVCKSCPDKYSNSNSSPAILVPVRKSSTQTVADFRLVAEKLPFFELSDFAYGRRPHVVRTHEQIDECMLLLQKICDRGNDKQTIIKLLTDGNPKVRTLALASLFDREEPNLLKYFVPLCDDTAETFNTFPGLANLPSLPVASESQTVGLIARNFMCAYLEPAGYYYDRFDSYWNERKNRNYCASWYEVRLERATEGTTPIRPECLAPAQRLIEEIEQLPVPDRCLEILFLSSGNGASEVITEDLLLLECKRLSPEQLLHVLQHRPDSSDPDLKSRPSNNYRYTCMMNFILAHAAQLLRRDQVPALLVCRKFENEFSKHGISDPNRTALWSIAIADLDRKNAKQVLFDQIKQEQKEAYRSDNCALLAVAVARILGESQKQFLLNYFFTATAPSEIIAFQRAYIDKLKQVPEPLRISLLKAILHDRRADSAHIWVWMDLTNQFEKQLGKARMTQYWSTLQQLPWNLLDAKSARESPDDAKKMQKTFAEVRAALRRAIPAN